MAGLAQARGPAISFSHEQTDTMKNNLSLRAALCGGFVAMLASVVGCGGGESLHPVTGKVVYTDGTPVTVGTVTFNNSAKQVSASSPIGADGSFALKTGESKGAPEGEYKVVVTGDTETYGAKSTIASAYSDPSRTPLRQTVVAGNNEVEIKVERAK